VTSGIALLILMTPFPDEKNEVARGEAMNRFLMQFKTDYPEIQNLSPNHGESNMDYFRSDE